MAFPVRQQWSQQVRGGDGRIAEAFGIDPVTARILLNRGICEEDQIRRFLYGTLEDLEDPGLLDQAAGAAHLLQSAILGKKKIRIIGDYDADGIFSTYILHHSLSRAGGIVSYDIPDRVADGFGISMRMIEKAYSDGIDLIITCDNGITQVNEVLRAKQLGMSVIITDHHEPNYTIGEDGEKEYHLPEADAVVDPKKPGCPYPNKDLCGAGVAWKLMYLLEMRLTGFGGILENRTGILPADQAQSTDPPSGRALRDCPVTMETLPFAAAATVTDIMKLTGENRILVKYGLKMLPGTDNTGMRALIRSCGLEGKRLTATHIGFVIGPCLNASGRLRTAHRAVDLLLEPDPSRALQEAEALVSLNEQRRQMTEDGKAAAFEIIENSSLLHDRVLVLYLEGIHESVAGIIASKVKDTCCRPVIVFTDTSEPELLKGSGRSVEAYNMHDELSAVSDLFLKFGGHPMAAGVTIRRERLEELRARLNGNCTLTMENLARKVLLDAVLPFRYLSEDLIREIDQLEPYGPGNRPPVFGCSRVRLLRMDILGKNQNCVKLLVSDGSAVMTAVYFGDSTEFVSFLQETGGREQTFRLMNGNENSIRLSLAYRPVINEFRGVRSIQLQIAHFR